MLAINFNIYERLIASITNFFGNWKDNLKFLLIFISGVLLSLFVFSNIIIFLINKYLFITMMLFIGLILGGTYKFSLKIKYNYKNIILIISIIVFFFFLGINKINNNYVVTGRFTDNLIFFIGGIIEVFASLLPGISATSLLMVIGIYDDVLIMISKIFNYSYVINNFNLYFSYGFGMFLSFFICIILIKYFINRYKNTSYSVILGLSISSILLLFLNILRIEFCLWNYIIGGLLLISGVLIFLILDK